MANFKRVTTILLFLVSINGYCEKVVMVFGQSLAPYIIEEDSRGIELLIIKEALALEGHELMPVFTQLAKVAFMFNQGKVDAAHRYITKNKSTAKFYYGDVTVEYHDAFFSLDDRNIKLEKPSDLTEHTLLSFQGAKNHYPTWLPEGYEYSQTSAQINQVKLLQLGLVDVVLSDKNIFNYNSARYRQSVKKKLKNMRMHIFTLPYKYNPVFKSKKMAIAFNRGLSELRKTGRYAEIISKIMKTDISITDTVDLTL